MSNGMYRVVITKTLSGDLPYDYTRLKQAYKESVMRYNPLEIYETAGYVAFRPNPEYGTVKLTESASYGQKDPPRCMAYARILDFASKKDALACKEFFRREIPDLKEPLNECRCTAGKVPKGADGIELMDKKFFVPVDPSYFTILAAIDA